MRCRGVVKQLKRDSVALLGSTESRGRPAARLKTIALIFFNEYYFFIQLFFFIQFFFFISQ